MTILWDTDPRASEHYTYALGAGFVVAESGVSITRTLASTPAELLVVIGPDIDLDAACQVMETVRVDRPEVGMILLRKRLDVTVLGYALRAGAREVVASDDLAALADACRRSLELSARLRSAAGKGHEETGRVITVFSAKGGVGKTTMSTNLAAYLASCGHRTLLIDLDLAFGDVAIAMHLDQQANKTMEELAAMAGHLDEGGLASVLTIHQQSGLEVLCAPTNPSGVERIPTATVTEVLRVARHLYEFIVVDTPPAITDHVLAAFDLSDSIVLIATLDIPALKNLRVTLETLDLLGSPAEARIVCLNRSDAKVGLSAADVVTAIRHEIAVMVPGSVDVPAAVNHGNLMTLDQPRHPVSLAIRDLADRFIRAQGSQLAASTGRTPSAAPETGVRRRFSWGGKR
ncbi:AAA family ATPase [Dermatophilaceae bacterium Soc4.6]